MGKSYQECLHQANRLLDGDEEAKKEFYSTFEAPLKRKVGWVEILVVAIITILIGRPRLIPYL